jgi:hypothetical protein
VVKPPKEVLDNIDKIRRRFLWAGDKALSGGKCKVNCTRTTLPKEYSSLGVFDLNKFATTLRVRWLWQEWTSPDKTWIDMEVPCTENDKLLFAACTTITLGDGQRAAFWNSAWLTGQRPKDLAQVLFAKTRCKKRTVVEALQGNTWIRDLNLREGFTTAHLLQLVNLWLLVLPTQPQQE